VFDQEAFAVALRRVAEFNDQYEKNLDERIMLQVTTGIFKNLQGYDRADAQGAGEKKMVFRITPSVAIKVGDVVNVQVDAQLDLSSSKKYVTLAIFSGGRIEFAAEFFRFLSELRASPER